jgi:hypothetical protein
VVRVFQVGDLGEFVQAEFVVVKIACVHFLQDRVDLGVFLLICFGLDKHIILMKVVVESELVSSLHFFSNVRKGADIVADVDDL